MKVILEFDGYEESEEMHLAINGSKYKSQLEELWQEMFRPRYKHGYNDAEINTLIGYDVSEKDEQAAHIACNQLMDKLEAIYQKITNNE